MRLSETGGRKEAGAASSSGRLDAHRVPVVEESAAGAHQRRGAVHPLQNLDLFAHAGTRFDPALLHPAVGANGAVGCDLRTDEVFFEDTLPVDAQTELVTRMREAVESGQRHSEAEDWSEVGTANMAFHKAIVALADSERLNEMFSHLLAELRLAFGLLRDPHFLHAPYVSMNLKILQIFEAGRPAEAAQELSAYLVHSERIILAAYARRLAEAGIKAP